MGWLDGSDADDFRDDCRGLEELRLQTSAFGKWHNTPADQTTAMGPFTYWPTSYGFEHFYGFLAGETSQWEPRLVENTSAIEPPHDEKYHLTEDMAANPKAPENKHVQYFDNNDSDGIYQDGWYACTFGPLTPWVNAQPGLADWDSSKDVWELYDLTKDFSQMHDLAQEQPKKLE